MFNSSAEVYIRQMCAFGAALTKSCKRVGAKFNDGVQPDNSAFIYEAEQWPGWKSALLNCSKVHFE